MLLNNKRADISITILVIGIFAICGFALLNFYFSNGTIIKGFNGISAVNQVSSLADKVSFYKNQDINQAPENLMDIFSKNVQQKNFVFNAQKNGDSYIVTGAYLQYNYPLFGFNFGDAKKTIYVEYKFKP